MIHFEGQSADVAWRQAAERVRAEGLAQGSRDGRTTRELIHATFTLTDPRQRLVFSRPINPAFAIAEVLWILAGANDVAFLRFWNHRIRDFADEANACAFHGAYGFRLGIQPNLPASVIQAFRHELHELGTRRDQIRGAVDALRHDPTSRQVVLQIWDASQDFPDPSPKSKDIPCNIASHLMIRQGKLEWLQVMRSNDLMWGTPYNFIQFATLQEILAGWLGVDVGTYCLVSDSLHVYKEFWPELDALDLSSSAAEPMNTADLRVSSYQRWEELFGRILESAIALTQCASDKDVVATLASLGQLPAAYREWMVVLACEVLRLRKHSKTATGLIEEAGPYWSQSWLTWLRKKEPALNL